MATRYHIRLKDRSGVVVHQLTTWKSLEFQRTLNGIGSHTLILNGDWPLVDDFLLDCQVEVWRQNIAAAPPIAWYKEYEGFHRTVVREVSGSGESIFTSAGQSYEFLLSGRHILYYSGSTQADKSGPGESVMKEYVNENAGPGALFPPRLIASGVFPGLTIEADSASGGAWTGARTYRNLLDVLQEIRAASLVDFGIVGTGPAAFEFRAKATPWGSDRSNVGVNPVTGLNAAGNPPMIFSLGFGNMGAPVYTLNRSGEVNAAIALGQGIEDDRTLQESQDAAAVAASPWNRREGTRQANMEETVAGLASVGAAMLEELQARETFTFQVLQTPGRLYGRDYFFGDLVTARFGALEVNKQIVGVSISVAEGKETVNLDLADVS